MKIHIMRISLILCTCLMSLSIQAQKVFYTDAELAATIKQGIDYAYNFQFAEAKQIYADLNKQIPGHPALSFFSALIMHWEYFPLSPSFPKHQAFVDSLNASITKGELMLKKNPKSAQGLFFALFPKCLMMLYYTENNQPSKTIKIIPSSYRQVIEGFERKEELNEFYFTTGVYNYYRIAYITDHPIYKPVVSLFHDGNKEQGIEQLIYAANNAIFIRAEAYMFLSDIYMNYEKNYDTALEYARQLSMRYPNNPMYLCKYIRLLLINQKYDAAKIYMQKLSALRSDRKFVSLFLNTSNGIIEEKLNRNIAAAKTYYKRAEQIIPEIPGYMNDFDALTYYGLSRIYAAEKNTKLSSTYYDKAQDHLAFDHITLFEKQRVAVQKKKK